MAYFETLSRIVPEATSGQDEAIREIRCGYATERESACRCDDLVGAEDVRAQEVTRGVSPKAR